MIASLIIAVVVFAMDFSFRNLMELIYVSSTRSKWLNWKRNGMLSGLSAVRRKRLKQLIESEITRLNLQDYISQVLIPTEKVYQIRKGKKISKERNYFPGYVLIEAALVGEVPHIMKNLTNVIGFLGSKGDETPTPLRMSEVNRILGKVDELSEAMRSLMSHSLLVKPSR